MWDFLQEFFQEYSVLAAWIGAFSGLLSAIAAVILTCLQGSRNKTFRERLNFFQSKDIYVDAVQNQPFPSGTEAPFNGDTSVKVDVINNSPQRVIGIIRTYLRSESGQTIKTPDAPSDDKYLKPFESREPTYFRNKTIKSKMNLKEGQNEVHLTPVVKDKDGKEHTGESIEVVL